MSITNRDSRTPPRFVSEMATDQMVWAKNIATTAEQMLLEHEHLREQIDRLATFIMDNLPGEPSQDEGAVDCAIRLLGEAYNSGEGSAV